MLSERNIADHGLTHTALTCRVYILLGVFKCHKTEDTFPHAAVCLRVLWFVELADCLVVTKLTTTQNLGNVVLARLSEIGLLHGI
jgi:hypothetical protein